MTAHELPSGLNDLSLRKQYDTVVEQNERLRQQVQDHQTKYLDVADERLKIQTSLNNICVLIGKSPWRIHHIHPDMADQLVDDIYAENEDCVAHAKTTLAKLEEITDRDMQANHKAEQEALQNTTVSSKLEDTVSKFTRQNEQFQRDVANRTQFCKGEANLKTKFQTALQNVVKMVKETCDDDDLVQQVIKLANC